ISWSALEKSRVTSLSICTVRNGPNGVGTGSPRISTRKAADAPLSREWTMVWLSLMLIAAIPLMKIRFRYSISQRDCPQRPCQVASSGCTWSLGDKTRPRALRCKITAGKSSGQLTQVEDLAIQEIKAPEPLLKRIVLAGSIEMGKAENWR